VLVLIASVFVVRWLWEHDFRRRLHEDTRPMNLLKQEYNSYKRQRG